MISKELQMSLEQNPPPPTDVVLKRMQRYLDAAGMIPQDLAHEINYSPVALRFFFAGRYKQIASNDAPMRHAVWQYMESHPIVGDEGDLPKRLLPTQDTRTLIARMHEARERGRIVVVEGPPGTCKTTAMKWHWAERNRERTHNTFYLECYPGISAVPMLRDICRATGAYANATRDRLLANAVRKLKHHRPALLLIDECQFLLDRNAEAFEMLRIVLGRVRCGCVLAGHFNFIRHLTNGMGKLLEQWLSRIDFHEHLRGLQESEIPALAAEALGEKLPADLTRHIVDACRVLDRNFAYRSRVAEAAAGKFSHKYLSIRRAAKLFERIEEMRSFAQNQAKPLEAIVRAAVREKMAPEARAL